MLHKNSKVRASVLSAFIAVTSIAAVTSSAAADPVTLPETGSADLSEALPEFSWLDTYFADALGESTPIGTKSSGRWIEYNMSNYCVTLHDGNSVAFQTCQTSSGKAGHATPTGSFTVKRKAAGPICMHPPGDKEVCGIHYATFFTSKGAAFHEAYWMGGRVNQRISHGCVNMRKGDAKVVYDFATIGMPVKVHW